jgi:hypothetical protein
VQHRPRLKLPAALALPLVVLGCDGDGRSPRATGPVELDRPRVGTSDAGTPSGHPAERRRGRVRVPATDGTAPQARLSVERSTLAGSGVTTSTGRAPARMSARRGEELRVTALARDADGGVARARISTRERSLCLNRRTAERISRLRVRYFPPAQIARAKVPPGVTLPRERIRTVRIRFAGDRCSGAWVAARVEVTLWADATNAHELESSSAPVRLTLTD